MSAEQTVWDQVVESARQRISTPESEQSAALTCKLKIDPKPTVKHLPHRQRNPAKIGEALRLAIRAAVKGDAPWPLFAFGPAGTGKTCAALCLLDHAGGEYYTVAAIHQRMIDAAFGRLSWSHEGRGGQLSLSQAWRQIETAPLIVLDELGCRDRVSDQLYETVKGVLDVRECKPLVVLSNLGLPEIERLFDDRIASRLAAGTVVQLVGKDRRVEK